MNLVGQTRPHTSYHYSWDPGLKSWHTSDLEFPVLRSTRRRQSPAILWLSAVVLLPAMQGGEAARAQQTLPIALPAPAAIQPPDGTSLRPDTLPATVAGEEPGVLLQRDALLGLANWDHTLRGAFELGARMLRNSVSVDPLDANAVPLSRKPVAVFSTSGAHASLSFLTVSRLDQLTRSGMNVAMRSALGNFNLTYREIFTGRPNSLGGGFGQASAAATFTTPRFGSKGMMDFSAAALMGTGSINTLMGGGFGNSAIGGNGPGHRPENSPTVAIKLTF